MSDFVSILLLICLRFFSFYNISSIPKYLNQILFISKDRIKEFYLGFDLVTSKEVLDY